MQPFFSIITPVLDRIHSIKYTIQSLNSQNFNDYEHIIVDNGSTDGTLEYCKTFENQQTKVFQCKEKGVAFARNMGIKTATGIWIIILDSDNQLLTTETLHDLKKITSQFPLAECILTSNINEDGQKVSYSKSIDTYFSLKEYISSSGEFSPLIRNNWYQKNLHPEIKGIINEYSLLVFIEAAINKKLVLSSYVAQRYNTLGKDRICSGVLTNQKAFELSYYYGLLLEKYGELVFKQAFNTFAFWSLKRVLYGKISGLISLKEILKTKIFLIVIPFWIIPKFIVKIVLKNYNS